MISDHPHPLSTTWSEWRCWWTPVCSRSEETLRCPAGTSLSWSGSKSKVEVFPTLAATAPDWIVERYPQGAVTPDSTTVLQYHVHHNEIVSFLHHLRDTFKVFFVLEPGGIIGQGRFLCRLPPKVTRRSPVFSWPRIMFSKQICYDFSTFAINALKESVLSHL